jgi:hypothetical protein
MPVVTIFSANLLYLALLKRKDFETKTELGAEEMVRLFFS